MNRSLISCLLYITFFILPLTDVFWTYNKIPLAIYSAYFACIAILLLIFIKNKNNKFIFFDNWYYFLIIVNICLVLLSLVANDITSHGIDYAVWFFWIYLCYGIFTKLMFDNSNYIFEKHINLLLVIISLYSVIAIIDWLSVNSIINIISINDLVVRGQAGFSSLGFGFIRLRGTIEEGAHYALFINIFYPISLTLCKFSLLRKVFFSIPILLSYILSAGISAWIFLIIGFSISLLLIYKINYRIYIKFIFVSLLFFIILIISNAFNSELYLRLFDKNDVSRVERLSIYTNAFNDIFNADIFQLLFGYGPANFIDKYETNPVSWYLFALHDFGIFSLFIILIIFINLFKKIYYANIEKIIKLALMTSILSTFIHYGFTGNIWHPWIWYSMPLCLYVCRKKFSTGS